MYFCVDVLTYKKLETIQTLIFVKTSLTRRIGEFITFNASSMQKLILQKDQACIYIVIPIGEAGVDGRL